MSIHKLTAGSGYDYLTRQVAALDATAKGHVGLASYYTERGESPGVWVGAGLAGIDGLDAGDAVTAEQMRALFGAGMHPLATQRLEQLGDADLTEANIEAATRLGVPFKISDTEPGRFRVEVARRIAAFNEQAGLPARLAGFACRAGQDSDRGGAGVVRRRAWPATSRCPGAGGDDREAFPAGGADGRRLRFDVLAGEVGVNTVGGRRPAGRRADRTSPPGRRRGCTAVPGAACSVYPGGAAGDPAGERARADSSGVYPSRQPRW